jgi:hypothetical protein
MRTRPARTKAYNKRAELYDIGVCGTLIKFITSRGAGQTVGQGEAF